jgi:DNA-binding NtrC family response regulator
MSGKMIMVIDDEKIVCDMAKIALRKEGYEVETFVDPVLAMERLKEQAFDLVITDLKMKGIDGMEVLRTIKAKYPATQVIMITAFAHLNAAIEAFRSEVSDFFPKPIKLKELAAAVKRAIGDPA